MIDYTLECIINSGICEILVVVCSHPEIIEQYIKKNPKYTENVNIIISTIAQGVCDTFGDVMRLLEQNYKHMISQDFILVSGFLVSTVNLEELMIKHKF